MAGSQLERRRRLYYNLSSEIALTDNARLRSMFDESHLFNYWGRSQVMTIGRSKVFVKRVPITDLEYENMFSTRNLYDLPMYYNYGFGSVGFGVFRELVTHIKTTNWVLDGAIPNFPLMYHHRIIPFQGERAELTSERLAGHIEYWGGSSSLERYILDRASANHELVLFLEYVPHMLATWLLNNPTKVPFVLADTKATAAFLRNNGILHLDSHLYNMLTDGKHVYWADFGLVLDKHFDLSPAEKRYFKQHSDYDFAYLLWNLGSHLSDLYNRLPDADKTRILETYALPLGTKIDQTILLDNLDDILSSGLMKLDKNFVANLGKYGKVAAFMYGFYIAMRKNNKKDDLFDQARLRRLLDETGFLTDPVPNG